MGINVRTEINIRGACAITCAVLTPYFSRSFQSIVDAVLDLRAPTRSTVLYALAMRCNRSLYRLGRQAHGGCAGRIHQRRQHCSIESLAPAVAKAAETLRAQHYRDVANLYQIDE